MNSGARIRADGRNEGAARRRGMIRRLLPGLGVLVAGAALTLYAAGGVSAQTWQLRQSPAGCVPGQGVPNGKQWQAEPPLTIDTTTDYTAALETNCGTILIALDAARAPRTVNSFAFLASEQYFDQTRCHRLTTEGIHVLQCGDPTATGTGGPGYRFPDENLVGATYPAGTLAMANSGPNTNGSQFFLVYRDAPLPPNYTPFGRVTAGMDVIDRIAAAGVRDGSGDGSPLDDVVLTRVSATRG